MRQTKLIYSDKLDIPFIGKLLKICISLNINPNYLVACIAFETGETFSPSIRNKQSGATGLIQFMSSTAKSLGTTTDELAKMDAVTQLDYVEAYFKPYRNKLKTLEDVYMAILYPRAIGMPDDYVLFKKDKAYFQNRGLDLNKDGQITKAEATSKVRDKLKRGEQFAKFDLEKYFAEFEPRGMELIK